MNTFQNIISRLNQGISVRVGSCTISKNDQTPYMASSFGASYTVTNWNRSGCPNFETYSVTQLKEVIMNKLI